MSIIRPLKPRQERHVCPDCSAPEGLFVDHDRNLTCKLCGWKNTESSEAVSESSSSEASNVDEDLRDIREFKVTYGITNRSLISTWASAAYDSALTHIVKKEWDEAIVDLKRALDNDKELIEAHLWLGRLLTDEKEQRDHLSYVIGYQPNNAEALLELMYLNGQVGLSQLEHALHGNSDIKIEEVTAPVKSETTILSCPICGGHMTTHPLTGHIECAFCGHIEEANHSTSTAGESLTIALLQQRSEGVKWVIGDRLLHCNNCGAETTITDSKMGTHCKFCGSNHIIEQDALNSFRQPDGIIPFSIPQDQAELAIQGKLMGKWERFKGVFVNNKVMQSMFAGTYMPFWVFDVLLDVKLSFRPTDDSSVRYGAKSSRTETQSDVFNNFPFPAMVSPSPRLVEKIAKYDFSTVQSYDPKLLASYPAEIYKVDFDKASLEARGRIRRILKDRYEGQSYRYQGEELVGVSSMVRNITFRLLLLPVWIATLVEDDGDVRIGLVNGQTGKAVLGKAHQPEHFG